MGWKDNAKSIDSGSWKDRAKSVTDPDIQDYNPSPLETGLSSLAPKGLVSSIYGAREALSAPYGKMLDTYRKQRDLGRADLEASEKTNPKSAAAGNITRGILEGAALGPSIPAAAALGGLESGIESKGDVTHLSDPAQRHQLGMDIGAGTTVGGLIGTAGNYIPETVGPALKEMAGNLAEKATGATRTMAEKFAPGAGKELLSRGIVKFGSAPKDIANAAEGQMNISHNTISNVLSDLDKQGVKASPEEIANALDVKISELNKLPGDMPQARKLEGLKEDIMSAMGKEDQPLSTIEKYKRSYGKADWTDPEKAMAQKGAYKTLMQSVEDKATSASPELADRFKDAKKTYGLLAPIQEASEKRALQLNQAPIGGLLDMASIVAGEETGHRKAGFAAPIARRILAPRAAASGAVSANAIGNLLQSLSPSARSAIIGGLISNNANAD